MLELLLDTRNLLPWVSIPDLQRLAMTNRLFQKKIGAYWPLFLTKSYPFPVQSKHLFFQLNPLTLILTTYETEHEYYYLVFENHPLWMKKKSFWNRIWDFYFSPQKSIPYYFFTNSHIRENVYYYELTLDFCPKPMFKYCLSMGMATGTEIDYLIKNNFLIGWTEHSIAFHTDDGIICQDGCKINSQLFRVQEKDVVGMGIRLNTNTFFFTLNGILRFEEDVLFPWKKPFYPCICMESNLFQITVNVGHENFLYPLV